MGQQLPGLGGFVQLPVPLRLNRGAHGVLRRYHFVKQLKAASSAGGDSGGGWSSVTSLGPEQEEPREEDDVRLRTILVANFDGTESDLRRIYSHFGQIESANPGKGEATQKGIGRVVFEDAATVDRVMQLTAREAAAATAAVADAEDDLDDASAAAVETADENADEDDGFQTVGSDGEVEDEAEVAARVPSGFRKWYQEHLSDRPGADALNEYCDRALAGYDHRRKEAERAAEAARNVPDEDGFITVSHRSRRNTHTDGNVHVKAASAGSAAAAERRLKAKGPGGAERTFDDFYRFQTRRRREDELSSMRTKFEADKQKIARAKSMRDGFQQRYKPY